MLNSVKTQAKLHSRGRTLKILGGLAVLSVLVSGCGETNPEKGQLIAGPKTPAQKNITSFTDALRCMDDLYADYGIRDVIITSAGVPDATGKIQAGTKDMMISAISQMSRKSKAFRFVDFDQNQVDILAVQQLVGVTDNLLIPTFYIRGAITQLDAGVASDRMGGGIAFPNMSLGMNKDQMVSVVSMDLNIGEIASRQIIPGMQTSNSISIVRRGQGADLDGKIQKVGVFFNVAMDRSEGTHASVRTLLELSLIEVLGKLTQVPYWKCLEIPQTNPKMREQARDWYDVMKPQDRVLLVQRAMIGGGYMGGSPTGRMDPQTREAVARYQAENDLVANGRISFDLYFSLLGKKLVLASAAPAGKTAKGGKAAAPPLKPLKPIGLRVTTNKGTKPTYRVGEKLVLTVGVQSGAHVYCYYQDGNKVTARIFPNRFNPDSYIGPDKTVSVPDEYSTFDIVMEKPGTTEEIACLASRRELGIGLPRQYMVDDLTPIRGKSLKDVVAEYRRIDRVGLTQKDVKVRIIR